MAQAAAVLLATSSGRALADELSSRGLYTSLIEGPDGVPKVLLGVNGQPVLNYWLAAMKQCPRLAPERVFVLCNESNVEQIRSWASDPRLSQGGLPLQNIITNNSDDTLGVAGDLAAFLAAAPPATASTTLVVIEADALCGPGFGLGRVVEHGVVRGKDTLTYAPAPEGMALESSALLVLEDPASAADTASQRVAGIDPAPGGLADPLALTSLLAPVAVLRPDTLERVRAAAAAGTSAPAPGLAGLVAVLEPGNVAHPPMFAMPVDCFFRLNDGYNLQLASNFHAFWITERSGGKGEAAKALDAARRLAELQQARTVAGGSLASAVKLMETTTRARPREPCVDAELRRVYLDFWRGWARGDRHYDIGADATPGRGISSWSGRGEGAATTLPLRFADATTRRHATKAQHPVYATSNSVYGHKPPAQADMPLAYAPASQHFTRSFPVTAPTTTGLVTAVTKSKVHKALDDF